MRDIDVTSNCSYSPCVRFEWDPRKRRSNLRKHRVDFADLEAVFAGETVTVLDERFEYGEQRFITVGRLKNIVLTIAHTETDELIRIVSARKATSHEEKNYFKQTGQRS